MTPVAGFCADLGGSPRGRFSTTFVLSASDVRLAAARATVLGHLRRLDRGRGHKILDASSASALGVAAFRATGCRELAIAVRRSPIHASRFARVFFSDASALRLRVGIQIKPKRTRGETSGTVAERASRRGFARRGLPPVRACALCIGRRRRKPWEFIPFQSLRLANSKFGSGQANFGKKNPKKKSHSSLRRLLVRRDVCLWFSRMYN